MKRRLLNFATNACLTIGLVIVCIWGYQKQAQMQDRLVQSQKEIEVLKQVKKQSDVAQSISEQMSDIADAERESALAQAEIAEQRAEEARAAQSEEKRQRDIAVRKSEEADEQRKEADEQRKEALKNSKEANEQRQAADSARQETQKLRLLGLGVSLSSMAITQYQVGNHDLARRLAYTSWEFCTESKKNLSAPMQALVRVANGVDTLYTLRGGITAIAQQGKSLVCVSKYGEVYYIADVTKHNKKDIEGRLLCQKSDLDFRDVRMGKGDAVYARDFKNGWLNVRDLTPIDITGIATTTPAPVPEAKAYKNGEIVIKSEAGKELTLQGMRSEVTGMARVEEFLFATSLDGTLRIWNLRSELLMPVTIYSHSKWIYCMHHDKADKTLYLGTADGMLLRVTISPRRLAERITDRLSQDEWNEFVGTDIEYRYSKK